MKEIHQEIFNNKLKKNTDNLKNYIEGLDKLTPKHKKKIFFLHNQAIDDMDDEEEDILDDFDPEDESSWGETITIDASNMN
jgi:hypothetical protein